MDYISYKPPLETYIFQNEGEETVEMEMEDVAFQYGNLNTLLEYESVTEVQQKDMTKEIDSITRDIQTVSIVDDSKKIKKHGLDQIRRFIQIMQEEGLSVPKTAAQCMIPRRIQRWQRYGSAWRCT